MSDVGQIQAALGRAFHAEGQRIVFWNDPDREFEDTLAELALDGVTTLRLDQVGALEAKIRVERQEPQTKFLLYSPAEEPEFERDWLLDIRLYSRSFRADRASIQLQELGLINQQLRAHLADRRKFFDAKDRVQKLKALVEPTDTASDLDRKMIAVVVKAEQPEFFGILRTIFHAWGEPGVDIDLDKPPPAWALVERFDLDDAFWRMAKPSFGYEDADPSLKKLLLSLLVTDFAHNAKGECPQALKGLLVPRHGAPNAVVCLAQWRDSSSKSDSYDRLSAIVASILKIDNHLPAFDIDALVGVMTFLDAEKRIASALRDQVRATVDTVDAAKVREIAAARQVGHWASDALAPTIDAPRKALHDVYDAVVAAAEFYALRNKYAAGFDYADATSMYRAYEGELFRFDQLYRKFCVAADGAEAQGWNIVKPMRAEMEAHYANGYLTSLALAWGKFLEPKDGLLANWRIDDVPNQHRFFERHVQPWIGEGDNRRAFVIVSDAFRFEAAEELTSLLNGKYRFDAKIASQLGVLPSYTALGMAALLPHKTIAYNDADVLVDGKSSVAGGRDAILQTVGGIACKAEDLMAKKKDEGREFIRDKHVVYVYHDKIDAIGDDAKTEGETCEAVGKAIEEVATLVSHIVNNLNGHYVVVTADHGFLFTESPRTETDKSKLDWKPDNTVLAKKRYVLAPKLPDHEAAWRGEVNVTAGAQPGMEFWVPKGVNLFHFVGGARFVHGGAMPQEIVVPVVTVRQVRGKSAQETKVRPVSVQVLGNNHRITSAYCRFDLIQMEAVSDRLKPVTLRVGVFDGDVAVTDVKTVKFESASGSLDDRKQRLMLTLKDEVYDKKKAYRLVLTDVDTSIEQQSVEVIIDRAFTDDF
jgi:uncharacterized protein (TIGR02687 family)